MNDPLLVEIRDLLKEMLELERNMALGQEAMRERYARDVVSHKRVQRIGLVIIVVLVASLLIWMFGL